LAERLQGLPWDQARADVAPFLSAEADFELLCLENLLELLRGG
jgi:hypothetical protein